MVDDLAAGLEPKAIAVDCRNDTWSEYLPGIVEEAEGRKFQVNVDLQQASEIVTYSPYQRRFNLTNEASKNAAAGAYQVLVSLFDEQNRSNHYSITFNL